jgi:hypothetical protein
MIKLKHVLCFVVVLATIFLPKVYAQTGEQKTEDSLLKIVNLQTKSSEKVKPLALLSTPYSEQGDSLNAAKLSLLIVLIFRDCEQFINSCLL